MAVAKVPAKATRAFYRCRNPRCGYQTKGKLFVSRKRALRCIKCNWIMNPVEEKEKGDTMAEERFRDVEVGEIIPSRWQPRSYPYEGDGFEGLKASIQRHGVLNRLRVFINEEGKYEIITGHRRLAAAREVSLETVPLEITGDLSHPVEGPGLENSRRRIHEEVIVDNLYHEDLTPVEEAKAIQGLMNDHGHTQQEVAHVLGKSQPWVSERLSLLKLAPAVQTAVIARAIEFSTARKLATLPEEIQMPAMKSVKGETSHKATRVISRLSKALEPGFWDLPEDEPWDYEDFNAKRLVDYWLGQVPEEEMGKVLAALERAGLLKPAHKFYEHELWGFSRHCGEELPTWNQLAKERGWTCENCLWREHNLFWQCGAEDKETCMRFLGPEDPVRFDCLDGEDCEVCQEETGWCSELACRIQHLRRYEEERAQQYDEVKRARDVEGREKLREFYAMQGDSVPVDNDHWLAQACEHCRHFRGPEHPEGHCGVQNPRALRVRFWQKMKTDGIVLVPRCSGFVLADLSRIPEVSQKAIREMMITWLKEMRKWRYGVLGWLYDEERGKDKFVGFLKESDLEGRQLAALVTMAINAGLEPNWEGDHKWGQIDPVTGEYSAWKLFEEEKEE